MDWKAETCNDPDNYSVSKLLCRNSVVYLLGKVADCLKRSGRLFLQPFSPRPRTEKTTRQLSERLVPEAS